METLKLAPAAETHTEQLLRELLRGQRELADAIVALHAHLLRVRQPASHLRRRDWDRLARILPAAAGLWGSQLFTSRDVVAAPALRVVVGGLSPKSVGRLLARGAGIPIDGYLVQKHGVELRVALWSVEACL